MGSRGSSSTTGQVALASAQGAPSEVKKFAGHEVVKQARAGGFALRLLKSDSRQ